MKVAQLIRLLSDYPADAEALVEGYENGYDPIHSLSMGKLGRVQNAEEYDGLFDTPDNLQLPTTGDTLKGLRALVRKYGGEHLSCVVITGLRGHRRPKETLKKPVFRKTTALYPAWLLGCFFRQRTFSEHP